MSKKKRKREKLRSIRVGNISDVSGSVNVIGGNITTYETTTGLSTAEIEQLFNDLYRTIEARPESSPATKEDIQAEINEIETTVAEAVQKNEKVDQSFLSRRFQNIPRMAPDVLDVIVTTLADPLVGLGVAVKRIAEKAKAETK